MLDREPFLRAIFANPDDDLPRLVFADWLDEHGDQDWAELIRIQCELTHTLTSLARLKYLSAREAELTGHLGPWPDQNQWPVRGFPARSVISAESNLLRDPLHFRSVACEQCPWWYGATKFTLSLGCVREAAEVQTLLTSPVTEHVTEFVLAGREVEVNYTPVPEYLEVFPDPPESSYPYYRMESAIKPSMINVLIHTRESQRITVLDLRNNNLDNDALRTLAKSPHLNRLQRLYLSEGNSFRGRVWQQVLERFGPDVVE